AHRAESHQGRGRLHLHAGAALGGRAATGNATRPGSGAAAAANLGAEKAALKSKLESLRSGSAAGGLSLGRIRFMAGDRRVAGDGLCRPAAGGDAPALTRPN